MARIRSIHPSFFTDEACVSCSPLARLLYIGLWTDADDQGLFEWKALQIKMRLLPGDNADANDLLAELTGAGLIAEFSSGGKRFGAIRDFRSYQRPKKPNSVHVLPPEWRTYVGLDGAISEPEAASTPPASEPVPHQFPTEGEKSPQMEDGGEDVREEDIGTSSLSVEPALPSDGSAGRDLVLVSPEPAPTRKARAKAEPSAAEQKLFDEFWSIYPRRVAKQPALEVYLVVIRRGVDPEAILQGLRAYASSRLGKDPEKTAHAATWLNAGRWTDEIETPPPGGYNDNRPGGGWDPMQQAIDGMDFNRDDAA